jgi:hypothetical protein
MTGCGKESMQGKETNELHMTAIVSTHNTLSVDALASLGDGKFAGVDYTLSEGDSLLACVDSSCNALEIDDAGTFFPFGEVYTTELPYRSGMTYVVSLHRKGYTDAPLSQVTLPDSFEILSPDAGRVYSDGDSIAIEWFPTGIGDHVTVENKLKCILEDGRVVSHLGDTQIDTDEDGYVESTIEDNLYSLLALEESNPVSCDLEIIVKHSRSGVLDPALKGGSITAETYRSVQVEYSASP